MLSRRSVRQLLFQNLKKKKRFLKQYIFKKFETIPNLAFPFVPATVPTIVAVRFDASPKSDGNRDCSKRRVRSNLRPCTSSNWPKRLLVVPNRRSKNKITSFYSKINRSYLFSLLDLQLSHQSAQIFFSLFQQLSPLRQKSLANLQKVEM